MNIFGPKDAKQTPYRLWGISRGMTLLERMCKNCQVPMIGRYTMIGTMIQGGAFYLVWVGLRSFISDISMIQFNGAYKPTQNCLGTTS